MDAPLKGDCSRGPDYDNTECWGDGCNSPIGESLTHIKDIVETLDDDLQKIVVLITDGASCIKF